MATLLFQTFPVESISIKISLVSGCCISEIKIEISKNGEAIPVHNEVQHLGHNLSSTADDYLDVNYISAKFTKSLNLLMANFGNVGSVTLSKLFVQYCYSFHGITLCNLQSKNVSQLCTVWRKAVRRIFKLPSRAHCDILPLLLGRHNLKDDICKRTAKFYLSMLVCNNVLVKQLALRCTEQSYSSMGKNVVYIGSCLKDVKWYCKTWNYIRCELNDTYECKRVNLGEDINRDAQTCLELINIRDGIFESVISSSESAVLLNMLCTS